MAPVPTTQANTRVAAIEILRDLHVFRKLNVIVISESGWNWAFGWAQLGVREIECLALTKEAITNLWEIRRSGFGAIVQLNQAEYDYEKLFDGCGRNSVVSGHIATEPDEYVKLFLQEALRNDVPFLFTMERMAFRVFDECVEVPYEHEVINHRSLGGLTSARLVVAWRVFSKCDRPRDRRNPIRPLGAFLEPAVRLGDWRSGSKQVVGDEGTKWECWRAQRDDAKPYPWPWGTGPEWVEAASVYFGGENVERPLTDKEKAQLLDLREDWSEGLVPKLWAWDRGRSPPLRMIVESTLAVFGEQNRDAARSPHDSLEASLAKGDSDSLVFDWSRIRVPGVGTIGDGDGLATTLERMVYFGWTWEPNVAADVEVATRSDDAPVDLRLWNVGGDGPGMEVARTTIRNWLHSVWRRRLTREAVTWLKAEQGNDLEQASRDKEALADAVERLAHSTWWEWADGSRLAFWRWPPLWQREARDGFAAWMTGEPKARMNFPSVPISEQWIIDLDQQKLRKLIERRYLITGWFRTTVPRFPVPKGTDDIRVVWDFSKNGLNAVAFSPKFMIPTGKSLSRRLMPGMYLGDFDVGEQFHNYTLHPKVRPYCGVRVPKELVEKMKAEKTLLSRYDVEEIMGFGRIPFGWQSAPYLALSMFARAIELAKGAPDDDSSYFQWDRIELNLPGSDSYDPSRPRVLKIRRDGLVAADVCVYFDDGKVSGPTKELSEGATRQVTSEIQRYGTQDSSRKRGECSQRGRAWAGLICYTDQGLVRKFVAQAKWDKGKACISWFMDHLNATLPMPRKEYESKEGFIIYLSGVYEMFAPYIHGIILSKNAYRKNRDVYGYAKGDDLLTDDFLERVYEDDLDEEEAAAALQQDSEAASFYILVPSDDTEEAPPTVEPVPRLRDDLEALEQMMAGATPIQVVELPVAGASSVTFGGGDASGEGFGSMISPFGMKPLLRHGFWGLLDESSNYRELRNLVDAIKEEVYQGRLFGSEVWIATDNSTAEAAFFKGRSSSKELDEMVLELRLLAIKGNFILRLVHIAGTRMIRLGIDGLSRGERQLAALDEATFASTIPLHSHPLERCAALRQWIDDWIGEDYQVAKPEDWFHAAQQAGEYESPLATKTWVWSLPPAAAVTALEELGQGRLKRHGILRGIVLIPNLLRPEWFRRFRRVVDGYFTVPAGAIDGWPQSMHEGLTVGFYLPLHRYEPWDWRCAKFMVPFCCSVSAMYKQGDASVGNILREFWEARDVNDGVEIRAPEEDDDYMTARGGDHLLCPFECDVCTFFRLKHRAPDLNNEADKALLIFMRRANLDAFWSRRSGTVSQMVRLFFEQANVGDLMGFEMFDPMGPFPYDYDSGMRSAVGMLWKSQQPGRHEEKVKFSTVRKVRALGTNLHNASAKSAANSLVWRSKESRFITTTAPTDSEWCVRFLAGFHARVGDRPKRDTAISIHQMLAIQELMEEEWQDAVADGDLELQRKVAETANMFLMGYCGSLRGFELPKIVLDELGDNIFLSTGGRYPPHYSMALTGRFKARSNAVGTIASTIAAVTASGLTPGIWARRLVDTLAALGITTGWLFQGDNGAKRKMNSFNDEFYRVLFAIQLRDPSLFEDGIDILDSYHLARSLRRGATTQATEQGVSKPDIDWANRWNTGGGEILSGPLSTIYAERKLMVKTYLRFSQAL